jgi:alpha 1,2-mannosyltransferase
MLRQTLGCKLPIEVYHFPDEMQDPEIRQAFIDEYDVQLKVVEMSKFGGKNWRELNATIFLFLVGGRAIH